MNYLILLPVHLKSSQISVTFSPFSCQRKNNHSFSPSTFKRRKTLWQFKKIPKSKDQSLGFNSKFIHLLALWSLTAFFVLFISKVGKITTSRLRWWLKMEELWNDAFTLFLILLPLGDVSPTLYYIYSLSITRFLTAILLNWN